MKFTVGALRDQIARRFDAAEQELRAQEQRALDDYAAARELWNDDQQPAMREQLVALLDKLDAGRPIRYADVNPLLRLTFDGGTSPAKTDASRLRRDVRLTALDRFLEQHEPLEVVSTTGLEDVGFGAALRMLHDPHARLVTRITSSARQRG